MKPSKVNKASKALSAMLVLTFIFSVMAGGMYGYSAYVEEPYPYFRNLPFPVKSEVHAAGPLEIEVAHCNRSSKPKLYETTRSLRNETTGQSEALQSNTVSIDPGCHTASNKINALPADLKPGRYSIWGVAVLDGYVIKRSVIWYSEPFIVMPAIQINRQGPPGADGKAGAKGRDGKTGREGSTGPKGETGAKGDKGTFWGGK